MTNGDIECVGAIDGMHVAMKGPLVNPGDYSRLIGNIFIQSYWKVCVSGSIGLSR